MANFIDLSGQKFGKLLVLKRSTPSGQPVKFLCQCDCGNVKEVRSNDLKTGKTISCGCIRKTIARAKNFKNLVGKRFDKLVVLEETNERSTSGIVWKCQCDCGKITYVPTGSLQSGNTRSCGCLREEKLHEVIGAKLVGQRFGRLVVIEETEVRKNRAIVWKCLCDCGNLHYVPTFLLANGHVKSCGCLVSQGEDKINSLLKENKLPFVQQKTFDSCIFPNSQAKAKFDFFVDNKYLIEFDGKQHFNEGGWGESFELISYRDNYKDDWCYKHNIPLIRIPYFHLNDLCIEDLKLETSNFIVRKE